jgi:hypothetical protein
LILVKVKIHFGSLPSSLMQPCHGPKTAATDEIARDQL